MHDSLQGAYGRLPALGQTMLLNAYGVRSRWRQRQWDRVLRECRASETWGLHQQRAYVGERLRALLIDAVLYVPRYAGLRPLLRALSDPDADVFETLSEFPVVTRDEITTDAARFISRRFRRKDLVTSATSGTTGTPLEALMPARTKLVSDALWWRRAVWSGYVEGDWIARLVGDPVVPLSDRRPKRPYRVSWVDRRFYCSSYHLNPETAEQLRIALRRRRPAFVMGYPSTLESFVRLSETPIVDADWKLKAVLYSSEPMYPHQLEAIAASFAAPIRGLYGCAERAVSAAECRHGSLHLSLLDGYVEGQWGGTPEAPVACVTGLLNMAMPLIRYQLGDHMSFVDGPACACGRTLPRLHPVVTKEEDCIVTPSRRLISPSVITWAFKDLPGVVKSQVVQEGNDNVKVRVLMRSGADFGNVASLLRDRLEDMVFHEMTVTVVSVDRIEMGPTGKTRFVVNNAQRGRVGEQRVGPTDGQ